MVLDFIFSIDLTQAQPWALSWVEGRMEMSQPYTFLCDARQPPLPPLLEEVVSEPHPSSTLPLSYTLKLGPVQPRRTGLEELATICARLPLRRGFLRT